MRVDAERGEVFRTAEQHRFAIDLAGRALAGRRVEFLYLAEFELALVLRIHTIASASGCSLDRSTLAASSRISFSSNPAAEMIETTFGLPR
jgi:hypothetical protein